MPQHNAVTQFLQTVCAAVRWKKAHPAIVRELTDHIQDQQDGYLAEGMPQEEAQQEAVRQMGDANALGKQFDAVYRPRTPWNLVLCLILLLAAGVLVRMLVPAGGQAPLGMTLGLALAAAAYFTDFRFLCARWVTPAYLLCLLLSGWTSPLTNGASYHVSYLLLLAPLPLCGCIYRCRGRAWGGLLECMASAVLPLAAALWLNVSPASLLMAGAACFFALAWAAGRGWFALPRWQALLTVLLPALLAAAFVLVTVSHRLIPMLFPQRDPQGTGYIALNVRYLLADAKWIGSATAFSDATGRIPTLHSDFLLAWLVARFGWISLLPICALFLWLTIRGAVLVRAQNSFFGKLLSSCALCIFSLQFLAYLSANCGWIVTVFFPMPLITGGNYSMLVNLPLMGVLLSAFRHGGLYTDAYPAPRRTLFHYEAGVLTLRLK